MFKFAFVFDMPGVTPENCRAVYENEESYNLIVGVPDMEATENVVKQLAEDGYTLIDFCGAYDAEKLDRLGKVAGDQVELSCVTYFPEEQKKVEALESFNEYGLIIEGGKELTEVGINAGTCNVYAYFVKDLERAKEAAQKLVEKGVYFIELCGWFDSQMTKDIIGCIGGAVPVGSAGIEES